MLFLFFPPKHLFRASLQVPPQPARLTTRLGASLLLGSTRATTPAPRVLTRGVLAMTKAQGLNPIQSTEATRRAAAGLGPSTESAPRATTFRKTNKPYPVLAVRVRDGIRTGAVADARARTEPPGGGG
jgi:hypothetical protein